jgi:polysaccharide export outer membrane protein
LLLLLGSASCNLKKRLIYLNENQEISGVKNSYGSLIIQAGDRLEIKIAGLEPESALPFYFNVGAGTPGINTESPPNTFLINSEGNASIPVLGELKLAGMRLEEAEQMIKTKLKDIIKSPVVTIRLFNFNISVMGEVSSPGYYRIINNRMNILEALSLAGDVTASGNRRQITVWRQEEGKFTPYQIDLTTNKLFLSPVFNLKQNDLIYVSPNNLGLIQPTLFKTAAPIAISMTSLILTTFLFFFR